MNRSAVIASGFALVFVMALAAGVKAADPERPAPGDGDSDAEQKPAKPPMSALPQKVLKVEERTITVIPAMTFADGPAPEEQTLRIDKERTKVVVFEKTDEERLEDGTRRVSSKARPGTLADLKAGQTVRYKAQDGLASEISILTYNMPERGKRGERGR